jgi:hemoglobin
MQTVFETAGGNDVLRRLAYAWHKRAMDDVAAHTFSHGFHPSMSSDSPLIGPRYSVADCVYSDSCGDETTVVKMHRGNGEHDEMNRRAIACFDVARADVGLANNNVLRQVLHDYFARGDHDNDVRLPPFRR